MILPILLSCYVLFNIVLAIIVTVVTLTDFYYETWDLRIFYEQIKSGFTDEMYIIPCSIHTFGRMTLIGKILFGIMWVLTFPGYLVGFIFTFILWSLYWIGVKVCFKITRD